MPVSAAPRVGWLPARGAEAGEGLWQGPEGVVVTGDFWRELAWGVAWGCEVLEGGRGVVVETGMVGCAVRTRGRWGYVKGAVYPSVFFIRFSVPVSSLVPPLGT